MVSQVDNAIVMVVAIVTISGASGGPSMRPRHGELKVRHDVFLHVVYSVQVRVQRVLTSILLATLGTNDISVLAAEMNILNMSLQAHFVEILVTIGATFPGC